MSDKLKPLNIGVAGLGTVGVGVVKMLQQNADIITARAGRPIHVISVIAGNKNKDRGVDISGYDWAESLQEMACDTRLDVIVEMIGGGDGQTKEFIETALSNGKHIVTANKALMAHHGFALAQLAEKNNVTIAYEAAIAGGIPIVKALREGLAGNNINSVYGILNGTCNYILTEMRHTGRDFVDVLKDAQAHGYAEADPTFDVEGIDAAHKLALLGAMAFGVRPDFESLEITGISAVTLKDIHQADELGYTIKLIGMARKEEGRYIQSMAPCFVAKDSAIGSVEGVFNAVQTKGDFVDDTMMVGRGAGEGPTASSVLSDIIDLAKENITPAFTIPTAMLKTVKWQGVDDLTCQCYISLQVKDDAGVLADVTACLKEAHVSVDRFIQKEHEKDGSVNLSIITHKEKLGLIQKSIQDVAALECVLDTPTLIRIEEI